MEAPKDDLKWFGEGFDGFPKRLPEDSVEYMLFIIDLQLTQKEMLTRLEAVRKEASNLTANLLKEYIWQRDEFNLKLEMGGSDGLKFLHGLTNYGDSVEDEWLIVYLLKELSGKFSDLWIKVVDTDGEFLLIEAANALPRWLNPEIADNRIWINQNNLRIIPLAAASESDTNKKTSPVSRSLTQAEAHEILSTSPQILIYSPLVEAEAFYRLRNYPAQIAASLHHARLLIPRKLAFLIHNCPASISPAVEAFYLRDPIALKPLQTVSSTLLLPPNDLVTISVKFTKVLYAQLKSQQFSPPQVWKIILAGAEKDYERQGELSRLEMGMKITSGYEMLLTDSKNADNRSVREMNILIEDLAEGIDLPTDDEILHWKDTSREDSESWLDINFEDFERELNGKRTGEAPVNTAEAPIRTKGPAGAFGPDMASGFGDARTQEDLKKMVQRFEAFLNDEDAGVDGAELDDMDYDDDDDAEEDSEDEDKEVSFDEEAFAKMMREMMGMPPDEEVDVTTKRTTTKPLGGVVEEMNSDSDGESEDEAEEIRKVMAQMEAELNEVGALDLDPTPKKLAALRTSKFKTAIPTALPSNGKARESLDENQESESDSDEVNIDFNLAKNLLESFKSQAGMAGPGGNLMGMMGMQLPRDEGEDGERIMPGQVGRRME